VDEAYQAELGKIYRDICRDDTMLLDRYLEKKMAHDYRVVNFQYPLQTAASHGSNRWLASLLTADVQLPSFALQEALAEAVEENHPESVRLLLAGGADAADYPWEEDSEESVPIVQAFVHSNPVVVKQLVEAGAVSRSDPHWIDDAIEMGLRCRRRSRNECLLILADQITRRLEEEPELPLSSRLVKKLAARVRKMKPQGALAPKELAGKLMSWVDEEEALLQEIITELMEGGDDRLEKVRGLLEDQPEDRRQKLASATFPYLVHRLRAATGAWSLFETFLAWGADVNSRDDYDASAMVWLGTHEEIRIDVLERLLNPKFL